MNNLLRIGFLSMVSLFITGCGSPSLNYHIITDDMLAIESEVATGADVNAKDSNNHTPLYFAAFHGSEESLIFLIEAGAKIEMTAGIWDKTPLFGAALSGNANKVKYLIDKGADVNARSSYGSTALHTTTGCHCIESAEILINAGTDIDAKDVKGDSAINYLIRQRVDLLDDSGKKNMVKMARTLLKLGARIDLKNNKGQTAVTFAQSKGNKLLLTVFNDLQTEQKIWLATQASSSKAKYQDYITNYPLGIYQFQAEQELDQLEKEQIAENELLTQRKAQQVCALKDSNWLYLSDACLDGFANGMGKAQSQTGLTFEGSFLEGQRTAGRIFSDDILMYDGPLAQGKPHGSGICMHDGEPEDCNYYYGKRTDALYKQRIEFAKQNALMIDQQQKLDEKLSIMTNQSGNYNNGNNSADIMTNALKRKAADKAADYLFDQLF